MSRRVLQEITGRNGRNITAYYRANGQLVARQEYSVRKGKGQDRYRHRPRGRLEYYAHDGLGSVVVLTNHRGKINTQLRYDVYGSPVVEKLDDNPYGFTGKRFDAENGLYHFHFRKYDPVTGVWTTEDPIRVAGGINLYGYVRNDPVNWIDPFGLCLLNPESPNHWNGNTPGEHLNNPENLDSNGLQEFLESSHYKNNSSEYRNGNPPTKPCDYAFGGNPPFGADENCKAASDLHQKTGSYIEDWAGW